ncbi:MAG: FKBP-type peptidyl-prolyl cis-trans isomerase [Hydrogenophaga sp.]|nr:FKBP-type peptidyl-prolyl cis-trans isomerase [Hydrogenophaga sp.]
MNSALRFAAPLVLASLVLSLSACKPENKEAAASADTDAPASAGDDAPIVPDIQDLETGKKQVSYMIGQDMGKSLSVIKDELDLEVLTQAIADQFAGKDSKLTPEQALKIQEAFTAKVQAKQAADAKVKAASNKEEGAAFLATNKDKAGVKVTESGLQYEIVRAGSGPMPKATDVVRVHYKGTLLDGTVFDSSYDRGQPAEFGLAQVIPGWSEGVALMPVGSKYTFWIPSELGYGEAGGGPIPANAMLTFEVELMEIVK